MGVQRHAIFTIDRGDMELLQAYLRYKAYQLRVHSLRSTTAAGSGHPTSCLSAADIVAVLFFKVMYFDVLKPDSNLNDHFILSKGHAAPLLYAAWYERGVLSEDMLLMLRKFSSVLEGHPTPRFPYVETATGSLGIGLSIGAGLALSGQRIGSPSYAYVLMGDMEMSEGSVWESMQVASFYKLDHLIGIVDVNYLGQSTHTMEGYDLDAYKARCEGFGWRAIEVDGHDIGQLLDAFELARQTDGRPTMIVARTIKGYGLEPLEGKQGYHGKALTPEELPYYLEQLKERFKQDSMYEQPDPIPSYPALPVFSKPEVFEPELPPLGYNLGQEIATRKAYGLALTACGKLNSSIVALDAEVKNSTYAEIFEQAFPDRFVQCFIAEQNMIGMGVGFALRGMIPFISTFGAFFSRAHDQIRMAAIGRSPLRLVGSHAGVSIGQDGPSQMALEDIALMRALPDSVVLYPCDAVSTYKLVACMVGHTEGISYLRTTRSATPVIYADSETFRIGGAKVLKESSADKVCVVAAGITVFNALKAYELLAGEGIFIAVVDSYSVKPLDVDTLRRKARACNGLVVTVEDHYKEGGLGEAVCHALSKERACIEVLAVGKLPRSGTPEELQAYEGIDADSIINAVRALLTS